MIGTCGKLFDDLDGKCRILSTIFEQKGVLINKDDIDYENSVVELPDYGVGSCDYTVEMVLKCSKKGFAITGINSGTQVKGYFSKGTGQNGNPIYTHKIDLVIVGSDKKVNCTLDALDLGSYVGVVKHEGKVWVYGFFNGLSTDDYDFDIVENGGANIITMTSKEDGEEGTLPLLYKAGNGSTPELDWEALFAAPICL